MIKVSQIRKRKYPEKQISGVRAYVSSSAGEVVDKFFNENAIYGLRFKCNTWNALKRKATASDIADLKTVFGQNVQIRYSSTAGCSCGCSPGYIIDGEIAAEYRNTDVWVDIKTPTAHIVKLLPDFTKKLAAEITKKNS
jgi:hypothetical protein